MSPVLKWELLAESFYGFFSVDPPCPIDNTGILETNNGETFLKEGKTCLN